ncbi:MAG: hypothetical protein CM1200mP36_10100 [Gammaproteobacteria bacterium]|nr:MAG: hypothetical protein CM1200mP36_10100 [Gammaproteobacteria bacterium]
MEAPYPFEIFGEGDDIVWHNEEYNTYRTIHMGPGASAQAKRLRCSDTQRVTGRTSACWL